MTERLSNALKLVEYALKHNITVNEACKKFNRANSYVRTAKDTYHDKSQPEYKKFLQLYKQAVERTTSIYNTTTQDINDVVDDASQNFTDEDLGFLPKDTIIEDEETITKEMPDGSLEVDFRGKELIYTVEQLLEKAKIDLTVWKKDKGVVNNWMVTMKGDDGQPVQAQNFQVKVWLSRIRSVDEQLAWDNFLKSIKNSAPDLTYLTKPAHKQGKKYLLEVSIPDLHIGKLAWEDESGENYDTNIAIQRYNETVDELLSRIVPYQDQIEEIIIPVGNDLINIDNMSNKTTAGTDQRVDSRWQQMFNKAKEVVIKNINKLAAIAPVKAIMVSGNHDYQTVYYLGCVLEAYYANSQNVFIDNSAEQRKYHEYGINMIGFTHGNEEKQAELINIMSTQMPEMWGRTRYREMHLGHFHSRKTVKYLDVQEYQGGIVRVLPSLSGTDDWHNRKGYMSVKSGVCFLYDKHTGLVAEYTHSIFLPKKANNYLTMQNNVRNGGKIF
jgi:hypothetical protein